MQKVILSIFILLNSGTTFSAPTNNQLRIGLTQEFDNLNPIITNMLVSFYLLKIVTRSFVIIDKNGQLEPQIVESIPTIENKQAKMITVKGVKKVKATWKIRKNAKWGDGVPVTCEDLQFSTEVAISGKIPVPNLAVYENLEKIEIVGKDKKTCVVTYRKSKWDFNRMDGIFLLPKHIEEKVFTQFGKQAQGYENNSTYSTKPTHPGLYNGPYKITEIKLGSHIVVEPNTYFYGEKPKIKKIILKIIPNTGTLEANILSKTIDMISLLGLDMDQALKFSEKVDKNKLPYDVNFKPSLVFEHIRLNLTDKILKDKNVRRALFYSSNREDLTKALFKGKQPSALHFVSPQDPWHTSDSELIKKYPYSLRKAKKLLEKSGWKLGDDGYRYKEGSKLSLSFMTTAGNKVRELVQQYLKSQWKKIGVEIMIKNSPPRVFFGEYLRKAKFGQMAMSANISDIESNPKEDLHSQHIPVKENNFSGRNRMRWKNKNVDSFLEKLEQEFNPKKRVKLAHKILRHYTEDIPVIPLFYRSDISVTPKNLKGYFMTGNSFTPTNYIEYWSLD